MHISKDFSLDYAHILELGYPSACTRLHGHTARVTLVFVGPVNDDGMVRDYTTLPKEIVMQMDHRFVVPSLFIRKNHPDEWTVRYGGREFTLPPSDIYEINGKNSTAEEIARSLFETLVAAGYSDLVSVTFSETAATKACYP